MVPFGTVIIAVVVAVVLAVLFTLAIARSMGGRSTMKKTSLEAYALFVCLVSLAVLAISLATLAYDVVQIANPELTLNSLDHRKHQTNDVYWEDTKRYGMDRGEKVGKRPSEEELTKKRKESYSLALAEEQHDAKQSLISSIISIIIAAVILLLHWKLAKYARKEHGA